MHRTARTSATVAVALAVMGPLVACSDDSDDARVRARDAAASVSPTPTGSPTHSAGPSSSPGERAGSGAGSSPASPRSTAADRGGSTLLPKRATSPREVAVQIARAERAIADPRTPGKELAAAGRLQQVAYRVLGRHPDWDRKVLARLPRELHPVVRKNVASRREFASMHPRNPRDWAKELPPWRIVTPPPKRELMAAYRAAEKRYGVDWEYLAAINFVETSFGRIRGTSSAGAQGPMQFMPGTWDQYGEGDVNDPGDAIMAAARYLDAMGFNRPGGKSRALWRYNNHNAYVRGVTHVAELIEQRPRAFDGYYHWEVFYLTRRGDIHLPVGYAAKKPAPIGPWQERMRRATG